MISRKRALFCHHLGSRASGAPLLVHLLVVPCQLVLVYKLQPTVVDAEPHHGHDVFEAPLEHTHLEHVVPLEGGAPEHVGRRHEPLGPAALVHLPVVAVAGDHPLAPVLHAVVRAEVLVDHPSQKVQRALELEADVGPLLVGQPVVARKGAREAVDHDGASLFRGLRGVLLALGLDAISVDLLFLFLGVEDAEHARELLRYLVESLVHLRLVSRCL